MSDAAETPKPKQLMDFITPQTTPEDLVEIVKQFLTPEDEKIFGSKEVAATKLADSIAYLGPFHPAPQTFDEYAFLMTAALDFPPEEGKRLLEIQRRIGAVKDEAPLGGKARFSISPELAHAAKTQFLT